MLTKFHACLTEVENLAGKNDKIAAIRRHLDATPELASLFEGALSPYVTYGVAKLPELGGKLADTTEPMPWGLLLGDLATRRLTGHEALREINRVRVWLKADTEREAFDRILLKDLRCGVSESSVNKAKPGTVPVFSCQLAPSEMPNLSDLGLPVYAEPKWDGVRTIAIKRDGMVKLFSRNGLEFTNFAELANALTAMPDNTVLDGEVISTQGFAALMTRAKGSRTDVPIIYKVFDGLPTSNWDRRECNASLATRRSHVEFWCEEIGSNLVHMSTARHCNSVEEIEEFYREQLALGLEGIMLKDPAGRYTFKRNRTWMKLKPFDTADLKVVGAVKGQGKYAGSLGALICEGEHQGKKIRTEVGSGFTDAQRDDFWIGFETGARGAESGMPLVGRIAEIRYQEITKAQDSDTYSLRFPTFVRWRDDK